MPANLLPIWPWIWLQHQLLLAWIRLIYGRGYLYCWAVTPAGRVVLLWIDLESRDRAAPCCPSGRRSRRALPAR